MKNQIVVKRLAGLGAFRKGDEILDRVRRFVGIEPRLELAFCSIKYGIHLVRHEVIVANTWTNLLHLRLRKTPMIVMSRLFPMIQASLRGPIRTLRFYQRALPADAALDSAGRSCGIAIRVECTAGAVVREFPSGAIVGYWNYVAICRVADRLAPTGVPPRSTSRFIIRLLFIGVAVFCYNSIYPHQPGGRIHGSFLRRAPLWYWRSCTNWSLRGEW